MPMTQGSLTHGFAAHLMLAAVPGEVCQLLEHGPVPHPHPNTVRHENVVSVEEHVLACTACSLSVKLARASPC